MQPSQRQVGIDDYIRQGDFPAHAVHPLPSVVIDFHKETRAKKARALQAYKND